MLVKAIKLDSAEKYTRLFSAKDNSALSLRSGHVILKENEDVGEHSTEGSEEMLIVLEGKGELHIKGSEKISFEKNTALYVPPNTVHNVKNTWEYPLRYIFITAPV